MMWTESKQMLTARNEDALTAWNTVCEDLGMRV